MIKKTFLIIINIYQKIFSPDQGILKELGVIKNGACVFYPTCSEYAKEVIQKDGILKGGIRTIRRIIKCHPWQKAHIDLVE